MYADPLTAVGQEAGLGWLEAATASSAFIAFIVAGFGCASLLEGVACVNSLHLAGLA